MVAKQNGKQVQNNDGGIFNWRYFTNALLDRVSLLKAFQKEGKKDVDTECEYPEVIVPEDYWQMYRRNGIARRVVNVLPESSWALAPEIYDVEAAEETTFEVAVKEFVKTHNVFHYLELADKVSGIGEYGLLFFGLDDGKELKEPIDGVQTDGTINPSDKKHRLLFLRVIPRVLAEVKDWEDDPKNTRFGKPKSYNIKFGELDDAPTMASKLASDTEVHWSRVIHCADNRISSEVFGTPRLEPVYNYILDLKKTLGGSAEMFWKGGFPGISFEMPPEVAAQIAQLPQAEQDAIKSKFREEFQNYQLGLQRYLATVGAHANSLDVQVADPKPQFDAQITAICITIDVPKPIFIGAETGELASRQNTEKWNKTLKNRQQKYLIPMLIYELFDRMIKLGVLETPKDGQYFVYWPDIFTPSELDIATIANRLTAAIAMYVKGNVAKAFPLKEYLVTVWKLTVPQAEAIMKAAQEQKKEMEKLGLIVEEPDPTAQKTDAGQNAKPALKTKPKEA